MNISEQRVFILSEPVDPSRPDDPRKYEASVFFSVNNERLQFEECKFDVGGRTSYSYYAWMFLKKVAEFIKENTGTEVASGHKD